MKITWLRVKALITVNICSSRCTFSVVIDVYIKQTNSEGILFSVVFCYLLHGFLGLSLSYNLLAIFHQREFNKIHPLDENEKLFLTKNLS